jgi:hypothetical protein
MVFAAFAATLILLAVTVKGAQNAQQPSAGIEEINKEFEFLGPDDSVLIHEEDGILKGQIDVSAGEEESDDVLSYAFTAGRRKGDHVEFRTAKVHEKYFRFSGEVQRGSGIKERDEDYLRLVGDLQIVTVAGESGKATVETKKVVLKSLSPDENEDDDN